MIRTANPVEDIRRVIENGFQDLFSVPTGSEWVRTFVRIPPEAGEEGPMADNKVQFDIIDLICAEDCSERIYLEKSSRLGYTTSICAAVCHGMTARRLNIAIMQPRREDAAEFLKDTVDPFLRSCLPTRRVLETLTKQQAAGQMRMLGGKVLRIRGGNSPNAYRRFGAGQMFLDEIDAFPLQVGRSESAPGMAGKFGEGSPIELAAARTKEAAQTGVKVVAGSTPTSYESSLIHDAVLAAQIRFSYEVACPKCDRLSALRWQNLVIPKKGDVQKRAQGVKHRCSACGKKWDYSELPRAVERGRFAVQRFTTMEMNDSEDVLPEDEEMEPYFGWYLDCPGNKPPVLRNAKGKKQKWPASIGLHVSGLYSVKYSWSSVVQEFLLNKENPAAMRTFTNVTRGIPYREGETQVSVSKLKQMAMVLDKLPVEAKLVSVGVDVQKNYIQTLVTAHSGKGDIWIIAAPAFDGETDTEFGRAWGDLIKWLAENPEWKRTDGRMLPVDLLAIDEGYHTTAARRAFPMMPVAKRYLMKGSSQWDAPIAKRPSLSSTIGKQPLYLVGQNQMKRNILQWFAEDKIKLSDRLPEFVLPELTAERLTTRKSGGRAAPHFVQIRRENHCLDCLTYACAAVVIANPDWRAFRRTPEEQTAIRKNIAEMHADYERRRRDKPASKKPPPSKTPPPPPVNTTPRRPLLRGSVL